MRLASIATMAPKPLLSRGLADGALVAAASVNNPKELVLGYRRVVGIIHMPAASTAAAGFPRVRQSVLGDPGLWDRVDVIPQDLGQLPEVVWTFDILLVCPFVSVEFTDGGGGGAFCRVWAMALPV